MANGASRWSRSTTSRRHSTSNPSVSLRVSSGLCNAHASAVRRHEPASAMPEARSAGQLSAATTANSRKPGPNQAAESRVASEAKRSPLSASTATTGRPACAQLPRCRSVHWGAGWTCASASRSGIWATSQEARLPSCPCTDNPIPATWLCRPSSCGARRAVAAPTRPASHSGKASTAASAVGHAGGAPSASDSVPYASRSRRVRSATNVASVSGAAPCQTAGTTRNTMATAPSSALQLATRSAGRSRTAHTRLMIVATVASAVTNAAPGRRTSSVPWSSAPCSPATVSAGSSTAPHARAKAVAASNSPRWPRACALVWGSQRRKRSDPMPRYRRATRIVPVTLARRNRPCIRSSQGSWPT